MKKKPQTIEEYLVELHPAFEVQSGVSGKMYLAKPLPIFEKGLRKSIQTETIEFNNENYLVHIKSPYQTQKQRDLNDLTGVNEGTLFISYRKLL